MKKLRFPESFLWGSAISAYQVEGDIKKSDWSSLFPSGRACNHYQLYQTDFDYLKKLNQNAFRFSLEWSRIEPQSGRFRRSEIEHYRQYLSALKKRGIKTMVTLHHFSNPLWFAKKGGWANKQAVFYFSRFSQRMFKEYADLVDFWITINEPVVYTGLAYFGKRWPPQKKNPLLALKVLKNQIRAHKKVYQNFKQKDPQAKIGLVKNYSFVEPFSWFPGDRLSACLMNYGANKYFLNKIKNHLDFIGLNYYFHHKISFPFRIRNDNRQVSDLGWEIFSPGLYRVLGALKKYNLPIYITENGVADEKDKIRKGFIKDHLFWTYQAIKEGVDVRGYFYWSLLDNLEWDLGFSPRFGLLAVDYQSFKRKIRKSALFYAKVAKDNFLLF